MCVCWVCWRRKPTRLEKAVNLSKQEMFLQTSNLEIHRVVHMIVGVVASLVALTNARHWYNLVWLKSVIWTKCRGFWKLQIIIQSCKFTNHRVVPMILWVVASMVTLTNARHWYNLEWLESVFWPKLRDLCLVYRYENQWVVPMVGWVLQLCMWLLQTVKCTKMAQPNSQENAGSPNFGLHINKKIKKITESREFGPVD